MTDEQVTSHAIARRKAGPNAHLSDCAQHNEPAFPNGACDCGASAPRGDDLIARLRRFAEHNQLARQAPAELIREAADALEQKDMNNE